MKAKWQIAGIVALVAVLLAALTTYGPGIMRLSDRLTRAIPGWLAVVVVALVAVALVAFGLIQRYLDERKMRELREEQK